MLHNKSALIMAGVLAALYFLYARLSQQDKQDVLQDITGKAQKMVDEKIAGTR